MVLTPEVFLEEFVLMLSALLRETIYRRGADLVNPKTQSLFTNSAGLTKMGLNGGCDCLMLDETIIAISTPRGCGGLGIVRLSGRRALPIAKKIFRLRRKTWPEVKPRAFVLGDIFDGEKKGFIDDDFWLTDEPFKVYTMEYSLDQLNKLRQQVYGYQNILLRIFEKLRGMIR